MDEFPSLLWHCWFGDRGHLACETSSSYWQKSSIEGRVPSDLKQKEAWSNRNSNNIHWQLSILPSYTYFHFTYTLLHTHTNILWLSVQRGWASTRRTIHPLTPIVVISHSLSASSINYDPQHPPCSINAPYSFVHNHSPSCLWSTSWPGTLHFILHTFLHPITVFFSQYMPIPSQPVLL